MGMSFWVATCKGGTGEYFHEHRKGAEQNANEPHSDGATYSFENESILDHTTALSNELQKAAPEILAAFAGLRPSRDGGARVEREEIVIAGGERRVVVHNYGAGGTGYQAGYGMAVEAVQSVTDILRHLGKGETRPRL
jgi:hypothetical protein